MNSAFQSDRVAAEAKITDKTLRVTGVVDSIFVKDTLGLHYAILAGAEKGGVWKVRCTFDREHARELKQLTTGQTVTVQGEYDGYRKNILMNRCVLVR